MSNEKLIERLRSDDAMYGSLEKLHEAAADALELADKRIAELEKYGRVQDPLADRIAELEHKLSVAREELLRCKEIMLHECGIGLVNEVVLAQIGGEDASS